MFNTLFRGFVVVRCLVTGRPFISSPSLIVEITSLYEAKERDDIASMTLLTTFALNSIHIQSKSHTCLRSSFPFSFSFSSSPSFSAPFPQLISISTDRPLPSLR